MPLLPSNYLLIQIQLKYSGTQLKNDFMKKYAFMLLGLAFSISSFANIKLPSLVGDNMVLQRDKPLKIWGWADKGEKVNIDFLEKKYSTKTSVDGKWEIVIPAQKAGGPYDMLIEGDSSITLTNILIGDVWFCGGQSNMEVKVSQSLNADKEIAAANNDNIRLFDVAHAYTALRADGVKGKWLECDTATVKNFSAVAYFFARDLQPKINVPIGIIECAYGGTGIEAWISPEGLIGDPAFGERAAQLKNFDLDNLIKNSESIYNKWVAQIDKQDPAYTNGTYDLAKQPHPEWPTHYLPGTFEGTANFLETKNGIFWVTRNITLTEADIAANCFLSIGVVADDGLAFVNGEIVGSTRTQQGTEAFEVSNKLLHLGENIITVRIIDFSDDGGMYGLSNNPFIFKTPAQTIPLKGLWNFKHTLDSSFAIVYSKKFMPDHFPSVLFNAMIAPLTNYASKGFLWYQGEANTAMAYQYRSLFKRLIVDWRTQFKQPDAPFIYVQLANFKSPSPVPTESIWAELRDAQAKALSLPNTAMVNAIDIGEAGNIHPKNKQDVGKRLALQARKIAYGETNLLAQGPTFKKVDFANNNATIFFTNEGSGLTTKDGSSEVKEFAVTTNGSSQFVKAKATITSKNTISVVSPDGKPITAVRYAWANNPSTVNLVNSDGLPAYAFKTDDYKWVSYDKRYEGK